MDIACRSTRVKYKLIRKSHIKVIPLMRFSVDHFKVLICANIFKLTYKNIDYLFVMDKFGKCLDYRLINSSRHIYIPNTFHFIILDYNHSADCTNELAAAGTVMFSSLSKNIVRSWRKAIKICIPKFILIYIYFE